MWSASLNRWRQLWHLYNAELKVNIESKIRDCTLVSSIQESPKNCTKLQLCCGKRRAVLSMQYSGIRNKVRFGASEILPIQLKLYREAFCFRMVVLRWDEVTADQMWHPCPAILRCGTSGKGPQQHLRPLCPLSLLPRYAISAEHQHLHPQRCRQKGLVWGTSPSLTLICEKRNWLWHSSLLGKNGDPVRHPW